MKYVKLFENFESDSIYNIESWPILYRWVTQSKLMEMCFNGEPKLEYMKPKNPPTFYNGLKKNFVLDNVWLDDNHPGKDRSINFTVDHTMDGAYFNDAIIRIDIDSKAVIKDLGDKFDTATITNGEGEVRYRGQIPNWPKYCRALHIDREIFENGEDFEGIKIDPIKKWLPKELYGILKLFSDHRQLIGSQPNKINRELAKHKK